MLPKLRSMRSITCTVIGAVVCLSLIFPLFFTGTSLSEKILVEWLMWSKSSEHTSASPDLDGRASANSSCSGFSPIKVFLYPMARKFNLGMLKRNAEDLDLPWGDGEPVPRWPQRSGLKKQHNVEYWMMIDLLDRRREREGDRAVVRVDKPEDAELFFVPFFSSLSFNVHGNHMRDPETEKDRILQEDTVKFLLDSKWWQRSGGTDHIVVIHHPNAFRFHRDLLNASIFIVADFGRYTKDVASLKKDVVAPYTHVVPSYEEDNSEDPFGDRKLLLYFQGRIKRKEFGIVRTQLAAVLQNSTGVHFEESSATVDSLEQASMGMRSSKFCLHPAGDTPSSCRLFDAIVSHCVPVIVSNHIELPFEDQLNYSSFSLFFSVEEAVEPGFLLKQLGSVSKEEWLKLWRKCQEVAHHFEYAYPSTRDDAVNMIWKQLKQKVPSVKLAINRKQRLKISDWWR